MKYLNNEICDVKQRILETSGDMQELYQNDLKRLLNIEHVLNTPKVQSVIEYLINVEDIEDITG